MGPSVTLSFVAHVLLVGAAVRGTAINARELAESIAQRVAYLPPPDRRGARENLVERLEYVEIGGGISTALDRSAREAQLQGGPRPEPRAGGDAGTSLKPQEASVADPVPDSVYSVLEVEERAARTMGSAAPAYPPELMKDGVQGSVYIRFVVDTSGRADSSSLEILYASHKQFAQAVRAAVPHMSFTPATVGGKRVRQAVEQNFDFRITPTAVTPPEQTRTKRNP
jgi:TonB family protein